MLHLRLGKSWALAALLAMVHLSVIAILFAVDLGSWIRAAAIAFVGWSLVYHVRQSALRSGSSCIGAVHIGNDDVLNIETRGGRTLKCEVLPSSFVSSVITVLNLRTLPERRRIDTVICCDCVDADGFRKLRVWLRWKARDARRVEPVDAAKTDDA